MVVAYGVYKHLDVDKIHIVIIKSIDGINLKIIKIDQLGKQNLTQLLFMAKVYVTIFVFSIVIHITMVV